MWRFARWSRSMPVLVACNAALVLLTVCVGWHASSVRNSQFEVRVDRAAHDTAGDIRRHTLHILSGNLRVVATLLAGACTLGLLTLLNLLWNAFGLGFGLGSRHRGLRPVSVLPQLPTDLGRRTQPPPGGRTSVRHASSAKVHRSPALSSPGQATGNSRRPGLANNGDISQRSCPTAVVRHGRRPAQAM